MNDLQKLFRIDHVKAKTGLGKSSIYRLMEEDKFPKSVKLTDRSVGWVASEINEWIEQRIAERDEANKEGEA